MSRFMLFSIQFFSQKIFEKNANTKKNFFQKKPTKNETYTFHHPPKHSQSFPNLLTTPPPPPAKKKQQI
jgi:hypothetical protein